MAYHLPSAVIGAERPEVEGLHELPSRLACLVRPDERGAYGLGRRDELEVDLVGVGDPAVQRCLVDVDAECLDGVIQAECVPARPASLDDEQGVNSTTVGASSQDPDSPGSRPMHRFDESASAMISSSWSPRVTAWL